MSKPPKRHIKNWDEEDCYTGWRKYLIWTSRPGAVKKVEKRTHRRERREADAQIKEQLNEEE